MLRELKQALAVISKVDVEALNGTLRAVAMLKEHEDALKRLSDIDVEALNRTLKVLGALGPLAEQGGGLAETVAGAKQTVEHVRTLAMMVDENDVRRVAEMLVHVEKLARSVDPDAVQSAVALLKSWSR